MEAALSLNALESPFTTLNQSSTAPWFTSANTWEVEPPILPDLSPSNIRNMKRHAEALREWLTEWVDTGSNSYIHPQLYARRFPRCTQDSYTTLTCYSQRTKQNENIALQIVEERAKELVESHTDSITISLSAARPELDAFEQLARVQALLVYQLIGLYDGDIRLRYLSERRIPILNQWMKQMISTASQTPCLGKQLVGPEVISSPGLTHSRNLLWYSWILAESMRRTFIIASGIQGIYLIMQQGRSSSCSGGMMFTTRLGAWEAQSALAWEKICSEKNVGLMKTADLHRLFTEAGPGDVNDFTKMILRTTLGAERVNLWEEEGAQSIEYLDESPEWQVL